MAARQPGRFGDASIGAPAPGNPSGDRRTAQRIDVVLRATVHQPDLGEMTLSRARAVDLSDGGARLLLRRRLPVGVRVVIDVECELPLRVHLGYDADSLVVDGPMHTHMVRVAGEVVRSERMPNRMWDVGIKFCSETTRFDELQVIQFYVEHLRGEDAGWSSIP